jgi:RNA polymerase sigma-70 factor, ECF subfamily
VARRLTADTAAAEDLVQETLLLAWRAFHQFRVDSNARAWLFRILVNEFRARARKLRSSPLPLPLAAEVDVSARPPRIEDTIEMAQALDSLSLDHRTVLMLGVVEGFSCAEMAEILALPIGTVMSRLSRARRALRDRLEEESPRYMRTKGQAR